MKILIVEDDEFKNVAIVEELESIFSAVLLHSAQSVKAAVNLVHNEEYNWIILDMALPSHDISQGKGAPVSLPSGGMELIMELSYMKRTDNIIIMTQYPQIELDGSLYDLDKASNKINKDCDVSLKKVIEFVQGDDSWKKQLIEEIKE